MAKVPTEEEMRQAEHDALGALIRHYFRAETECQPWVRLGNECALCRAVTNLRDALGDAYLAAWQAETTHADTEAPPHAAR